MSIAQPINDDQPKPDTYALFRTAIEKRLQVVATYAEPARKGLGAPGSPENWRCLLLADLASV